MSFEQRALKKWFRYLSSTKILLTESDKVLNSNIAYRQVFIVSQDGGKPGTHQVVSH